MRRVGGECLLGLQYIINECVDNKSFCILVRMSTLGTSNDIHLSVYIVDIDYTSFDVHIVDIVDIAMSTMLNRYRVNIVDIADISLTLTSSKFRCRRCLYNIEFTWYVDQHLYFVNVDITIFTM